MTTTVRRYWVDWTLVVLALGAVLAVALTAGQPTTDQKKAREHHVLAVFQPDDCRRMVLERAGRKIVLERGEAQDADWRVVEPLRETARASTVRELWHSLELARWVRRFAPDEVLRSEFGLDAPRAVVTLDMGSLSYRLVLGKTAISPPGSAYLELGGEGAPGGGVMLVEADLAKHLELTLEDLREPTLVPLRPEELAQWVLQGPGGTRRFRRQDARWRFDGMQNDRLANRRVLDLLFAGIGKLDSERVLDPAEAERALRGQETVTVTLVPANARERRVVLELGGHCPGQPDQIIVLRREPDRRSGCLGAELWQTLSLPAEALVLKKPFTLRPDEVETLSIASGPDRLELARKASGFVLRAPKETEVPAAAGNQRLAAMLDAEGSLVEGANLQDLGLEHPVGRVVASSVGASEARVVEETVLVGAPDAQGHTHVLRQTDGAVLAIDAATARALTPDTTLLRSLELWNHSSGEVRAIELDTSALHVRLVQPSPGAFELVEPKGFKVDAAVASDWAEALAHLSAERWASDHDDGSYGLSRPETDVRLEVKPGAGAAVERRLRVGHRTSGGAFAATDRGAGVFVLARKTVDLLGFLPIDRSALMVDTQAASRITLLGRGGEKLGLSRTAGTLERIGGSTEPRGASLDEVVEALGSLRAEACLHTGPERREEGLGTPALVIEIEYPAGYDRARQKIRFGAVDGWQDATVRYARAEGIDATFVVMKSKVEALFHAW